MNKLKQLVLGAAAKVRWAAPLLARVAVGYVFIETGWGKLHNLEQVTQFFTQLGIPAANIQAPFVASVEFVCGILVFIGLATRLASIPLMGTMVVAIMTAKRAEIAGISDLFMMSEFLMIVVFFWLFAAGPGPVSADQLICRECAGTSGKHCSL